MNKFSRTTRECSLDDLRPDIAAAVRRHVTHYQLENIESSVTMCCETTSTEIKKGFFNKGSAITVTGKLLTPEWLIIAEKKENEEPEVISGQLKNLEVHDFEETAMFKINPDQGLNITGRYSDVTRHGMAFIGLGSEPAAQKFRQALHEAVQKTAHW